MDQSLCTSIFPYIRVMMQKVSGATLPPVDAQSAQACRQDGNQEDLSREGSAGCWGLSERQ